MIKNQLVSLQITAMSHDGNGIGRAEDGMTVFVPQTAIGDLVVAKITKATKHYCFGIIQELIKPSPDRIEPDCPVYCRCGGCCYRHITYEAELEIKKRKVLDALRKIGGIQLEQLPISPALSRSRYRNKAQLPVAKDDNGKIIAGFYAPRSHRIIRSDDCLIAPEVFSQITGTIKEWAEENAVAPYEETAHTGLLRHIYLRQSDQGGKIMVCLVINGETTGADQALCHKLTGRFDCVASIQLNINRERTNVVLGDKNKVLYGSETLEDRLCGLDFHVSPHSFYQINHRQTEVLYAKAAEFADLTGAETVLDLYCGVGTIGLSMASRAGTVIGAEIVPEAVENARENARRNGVSNARFLCGDANEAAVTLMNEGIRPNVVIIDPPRKGCGPGLVDTICAFGADRVVYVSCDPATLARDVADFAKQGYLLQKAHAVDMFPGTYHVETCVLLSHKNPQTSPPSL